MRRLILTASFAAFACGTNPVAPARPPAAADVTAWITGVVTDYASGTPLAGASVTWAGTAAIRGDRGGGAATDESGRYRIEVGYTDHGTVSVRAQKEGFFPNVVTLTISREGTFTANFALGRAVQSRVTGVVRDAVSGAALPGAQVEWAGIAEAWGDRGSGVTTDAEGRYQLWVGPLDGPGSGNGAFSLRASKAGYSEAHVIANLAQQTVNFDLRPVEVNHAQ